MAPPDVPPRSASFEYLAGRYDVLIPEHPGFRNQSQCELTSRKATDTGSAEQAFNASASPTPVKFAALRRVSNRQKNETTLENRPMKTPTEYRTLAAECRALARSAQNEEHRIQLLKMAEGWDQFALQSEQAERAAQLDDRARE